ncbi:hypothetical protein NY2A_b134L [Paramecium bursaria Chlorella virus NY2A]|uniref:Uncharacterized protein b134L n=1 Tax=Paramecium bursaria Chlorella virus NY2A TaxID=46021 RepID=A7IW09_PBCVN|nr:hypothetical protein NY2A_b134L [Paramecium bursaria Chlorella virus NY2A]ABT14533.1 hypothetical protein NY2A_b134L [Paramecium bursaria Chlorella virus NY2A]
MFRMFLIRYDAILIHFLNLCISECSVSISTNVTDRLQLFILTIVFGPWLWFEACEFCNLVYFIYFPVNTHLIIMWFQHSSFSFLRDRYDRPMFLRNLIRQSSF